MSVFAVVLVLVSVSAWVLIRNRADTDVVATPSTVASTTLQSPSTMTGEWAIETAFDSTTALLFVPGIELVEGKPCAAINEDGGIGTGTRLTVSDVNGRLIGTGALGSGVLALKPGIEDRTVPAGSSAQRTEFVYANADCVFGFTVELVNESDFYIIAVGDGDGLTYSHLELVSYGWFPESAQSP